jgi:hypothetical protein
MLDLGFTLIDRFIQLLTERRAVTAERVSNRRAVIQDVIDPLASDMEMILKNYLSILREVESQVSNPDIEPSIVIADLRKLREELEVLRTKVRAMALVFLKEEEAWRREPEEVVLLKHFAAATGGVFGAFAWAGIRTSPDDEERIFFDSSLTYRLMYTLEYIAASGATHEVWRQEALKNINALRLALRLRWENFVEAYAELRMKFLLET